MTRWGGVLALSGLAALFSPPPVTIKKVISPSLVIGTLGKVAATFKGKRNLPQGSRRAPPRSRRVPQGPARSPKVPLYSPKVPLRSRKGPSRVPQGSRRVPAGSRGVPQGPALAGQAPLPRRLVAANRADLSINHVVIVVESLCPSGDNVAALRVTWCSRL